MRKDADKKTDRNKKIMVYFIAGIMILSVFGVIFYQEDSGTKKKYKSYSFEATQQGYMTIIDKKQITLTYFPGNLEEINLSADVKSLLTGKQAIIMTSSLSDPLNQTIAEEQYNYEYILTELGKTLIGRGYIQNNTYKPIVTCNQSTFAMPVIYFKKGNESSITADGSCVIIQAEDRISLMAESQRVLYTIIGIME